jgi:hypothetical protein
MSDAIKTKLVCCFLLDSQLCIFYNSCKSRLCVREGLTYTSNAGKESALQMWGCCRFKRKWKLHLLLTKRSWGCEEPELCRSAELIRDHPKRAKTAKMIKKLPTSPDAQPNPHWYGHNLVLSAVSCIPKTIPRAWLIHRPENVGSKYLRNVGELLPDYLVLQSRRQSSSDRNISSPNRRAFPGFSIWSKHAVYFPTNALRHLLTLLTYSMALEPWLEEAAINTVP